MNRFAVAGAVVAVMSGAVAAQSPDLAAKIQKFGEGAKVPHLLKSARRVGFLAPEILEALGLSAEPLIRGALRGSVEAD